MAKADTGAKNRALEAIAAAVERDAAKLLAAGTDDVAVAKTGLESSSSTASP